MYSSAAVRCSEVHLRFFLRLRTTITLHHSRRPRPSVQTGTEGCGASAARRLRADAHENNDSSRSFTRVGFARAQVRINGRGFVQDGILI